MINNGSRKANIPEVHRHVKMVNIISEPLCRSTFSTDINDQQKNISKTSHK